ncbi:MAG TPA: hypothetical protein VHM91_00270, partial [Verrucomicrobiales bacterium]|nr:hypothetical protein [Verrucomicrobiales bacterium]
LAFHERVMLKPVLRFVLPACAGALILFLLRDRPGGKQEPFARVTVEPAAVAGKQETVDPASLPLSPPPAPPAGIVIPRTNSELNTFADSPRPLGEKISVLYKMMRDGPPEQAKAAAIRAIFIVKNADFVSQLRPLIVAGEVKPEALEVLSLNLYDRPLDLLLPTWALIRDRPGHPLHEAAADGLAFHLKEKAGLGSSQLAQVIQEYLKVPAAP